MYRILIKTHYFGQYVEAMVEVRIPRLFLIFIETGEVLMMSGDDLL